MHEIPAVRVDAFTRDGAGGNPAGVVLGAPSDAEAQRIAARLGFSETAFVDLPDIRFFTPTSQVGLCGHATVAAFHRLSELSLVAPGRHPIHTASGPQTVRLDRDGRVWLSQNAPQFGSAIDPENVATVLGIPVTSIVGPVTTASTGLWKIFIIVDSADTLSRLVPDHAGIEAVARANDAIGVYVVTRDAPVGVDLLARNFAPVVGIVEDAATGTSAAAVSALLAARGEVSGEVRVYQGDALSIPAELFVRLGPDGIEVGGYAVTRPTEGG